MESDYTQIVEGCRRRDPRSQRALYDALAPMALGVCMRYSHDRHTAQDLMQDGFVKVFENIARLQQPERLGAWVYQIMVNRCLNHLKKRREELCPDGIPPSPIALPLDPFAMEEIVLALQQLSPQQRMVFNLVEVDDRPYDEVADILHCSESNVRALLCRAKSRLRDLLTSNK